MIKRLFLTDFKNQGKPPHWEGLAPKRPALIKCQTDLIGSKEMNMSEPEKTQYTCQDFRMEMTILGLRRRLHQPNLSPEERQEILDRLRMLEAEAGMD